MAKFIPPAGVVKVSKADTPALPECVWPLGTLYLHVASNTYFRFLQLGNKWDRHYGISTARGVLVGARVSGQPVYAFEYPTRQSVVSHADKNEVVKMLLSALTQAPN